MFLWPPVVLSRALLLVFQSLLETSSALANSRSHIRDRTGPPRSSKSSTEFVLVKSGRASASLDRNERARRIGPFEAPCGRVTRGETSVRARLGQLPPHTTLGKVSERIVGSAHGEPSVLGLGGTGREASSPRGNVVCRRDSRNDSSGLVGVW